MVSKDTIVVVVVAAVVLVAILIVVAFRLVKKVAATSNPLPPVQPLAHHREQHIAKFDNTLARSQTWYNSQTHLVAPGSVSARASRASLLSKNSPTVSSPADTESAISYSPLNYDNSLPIPSPPFHPTRVASSSDLTTSQPPIPADNAQSASSPRPLSVSSSHSTLYSRTSRHTLRGTPHGPHSQIQIVLPTPLGGELLRSASARLDGEAYDRTSVVDRWLSPGTPSTSEGAGRRSLPPVPRLPSMYGMGEVEKA